MLHVQNNKTKERGGGGGGDVNLNPPFIQATPLASADTTSIKESIYITKHRRSDAGRNMRIDARSFSRALESSGLDLAAVPPPNSFKNSSMLLASSVHV